MYSIKCTIRHENIIKFQKSVPLNTGNTGNTDIQEKRFHWTSEIMKFEKIYLQIHKNRGKRNTNTRMYTRYFHNH